jgi:hypothetical protein
VIISLSEFTSFCLLIETSTVFFVCLFLVCVEYHFVLYFQGYLAQVLAFQYQHPVIAIDACSHHGLVTDARAERIKKHYTSQMVKSG